MGVERKRDIGSTMRRKKSDTFIFFSTALKSLLGWGNRCLFVCENQHLIIILFMAKNHLKQSYVLRARMIAMCAFLYNVNMIISKLTF